MPRLDSLTIGVIRVQKKNPLPQLTAGPQIKTLTSDYRREPVRPADRSRTVDASLRTFAASLEPLASLSS